MVVINGHMVVLLVTQSCPTLCDPIDCSPSGFSDHGILQGIFLAQGLNPGLLYGRQIPYHLSYVGNKIITIQWQKLTIIKSESQS